MAEIYFDKRYVKGKYGTSHKYWPGFHERGNNGIQKILLEPIPEYFKRPGDVQLTAATFDGIDNNASIIFGRDRSGIKESDSPFSLKKGKPNPDYLGVNSFGEQMGAGSIDIVVGRMAPFPLALKGYTVGPMFTTKTDIQELALETLDGVENNIPFGAPHPRFAMDAARIYISQMSDVDNTFKIAKNVRALPSGKGLVGKLHRNAAGLIQEEREKVLVPNSSIMLKADKLRMHSRHDIKIVTGGESYDSTGELIMKTGGIHLVAGNKKNKNQPIPLGRNLEQCLESVLSLSTETLKIIQRFCKKQMSYNDVLSKHEHLSPFGPGLAVTMSITGAPAGIDTVVHQFLGVTKQIDNLLSEITRVRRTFLEAPSTENEKTLYINSVYNTTN